MTSDHTLVRRAFSPAAPPPGTVERLDLATTVDEVLRLLPHGRVVLAAFRVDASHGARTIAEAARAADLEPDVLLDALRSTVCASFDAAAAAAEVRRTPTTSRSGGW